MIDDVLANPHSEEGLVDNASFKLIRHSRNAAKSHARATNQIISGFHFKALQFFKLIRRDVVADERAIVVDWAILLVNLEALIHEN